MWENPLAYKFPKTRTLSGHRLELCMYTRKWYRLQFRSLSGQRCNLTWCFNVKTPYTSQIALFPQKLHFLQFQGLRGVYLQTDTCQNFNSKLAFFLVKMHHIFGQKHPFYTYENALFSAVISKGATIFHTHWSDHLEISTLWHSNSQNSLSCTHPTRIQVYFTKQTKINVFFMDNVPN